MTGDALRAWRLARLTRSTTAACIEDIRANRVSPEMLAKLDEPVEGEVPGEFPSEFQSGPSPPMPHDDPETQTESDE